MGFLGTVEKSPGMVMSPAIRPEPMLTQSLSAINYLAGTGILSLNGTWNNANYG